jgi:hypothetical protein
MSNHIDWHRPQPAPKEVARRLRTNFPMITATGIYNDRNVAGTNIKSSHAEGRGLDVHLSAGDQRQRLVGDQLFKGLQEVAAMSGIANVIWNRKIWSTQHPHARQYTGDNPHLDHIHIEFTRPGSQLTVFRYLEVKIAQIRSGLEDLERSRPEGQG